MIDIVLVKRVVNKHELKIVLYNSLSAAEMEFMIYDRYLAQSPPILRTVNV